MPTRNTKRRSSSKLSSKSKSIKRRSTTTRKKCKSGYVLNRSTKRCVFKTGRVGRSLNKHRASKKRATYRSGRPSPQQSATLFAIGSKRHGLNGKLWKVKKASNGVKRWVPVK